MVKANVGLLYSESHTQSSESKNLAHYIAGLLATSGYVNVFLIPLQSDGAPVNQLPNRRISYFVSNSSIKKPIEVPVSFIL